jgi:O-antigen/teichoic acid export membrane protein
LFALGSVIGKFVGLAMLPVLTRLMTPTEFGHMDVLMSLGSALTVPLLLGLDVATLRLYFEQPDQQSRRTLVGSAYAVVLLPTLAAGAIVAIGSGVISGALFGGAGQQIAVAAVAVSVVAGAIQTIALTVLRAQARAALYAAVFGGTTVVYALFGIVLLTTWRADANAMLVAHAASVVVLALVGTFLVRHDVIGKPTRSAARALLRLGLPMTPAVAAVYVADFVNRTILLGAAGAAGVAQFSVAARFGSVAALAATGFRLAWLPRAYALGTGPAALVRLASDARWIVAIVCTVVTLLALASPAIVELAAGPQYLAALPPLGFYLVAVLLGALALVASLPSAVAMATQDLAMASIANVAVALGCNLALAAPLQATGTAIAFAAGEVAETLLLVRFGMRRLPMPVDWLRLGGVVAAVGLCVVALLVVDIPLPSRVAVSGIALGVVAWSVPLRGALRSLGGRARR